MAVLYSDPTMTASGEALPYQYNTDYDFGGDKIWGQNWKTAISRGDLAYAQRLENVMKAQAAAPGMQNANNAWWNNRLNTGSVPTNTQPLNLGQISVTAPNDPGYQNIPLGAKPMINPTSGAITYGQGNSGAGWGDGIMNKFYKNQPNSQSLANLPQNNTTNTNNTTTPKLYNIDWSNQQQTNSPGYNNSNRTWENGTGTYQQTGY